MRIRSTLYTARIFVGASERRGLQFSVELWHDEGATDKNTNNRGVQSPFGELEPYAGKLARTVLRGARGRQRPLPTRPAAARGAWLNQMLRESSIDVNDFRKESTREKICF